MRQQPLELLYLPLGKAFGGNSIDLRNKGQKVFLQFLTFLRQPHVPATPILFTAFAHDKTLTLERSEHRCEGGFLHAHSSRQVYLAVSVLAPQRAQDSP